MIDILYPWFQHWSASGSVYIMSDTHFDDPDCKLMDPNWISAREQADILKSIVHKTDTLILLGDIGDPKYLSAVKGHKVLLAGNHDGDLANYAPYFDEYIRGPLIISTKVLCSHEPLPLMPFWLNIHGHSHGGPMRPDPYHLNVAANVVGYRPVSLGALIKDGYLNKIKDIHRLTIDKASADPLHRRR